MKNDNKALVHRWFEEVWNKGRMDAISEMMSTEAIAHGLTDHAGNELRGADGFRAFAENFRKAFPDIRITVEDTVSEGDKIAARCSVQAIHSGDGIGIAATNKPMAVTGMTMVRIKDGKIVEAWNNFDFMSLFQQLGVLTIK